VRGVVWNYNARRAHRRHHCEADEVEVSWDEAKSKWLVRIVVGEESGEAGIATRGKKCGRRVVAFGSDEDAAG